MNRLVRTELLKQRTTRTGVVAFASTPLIAALITLAILIVSGKQGNDPLGPESLVHIIGGPAGVITVVALMLGIVGMAGEYRHQTVTTTFLAAPRRRDVVVAKLVTHSLIGALMGVLSLVVSTAIAIPWLLASDVPVRLEGEGVRVAFGLLVSTALYGALGVAVGALLRNQTTAIAVVLAWVLAVEGVIGDLVHGAAFVRWLPVAAGQALVRVGSDGDTLPRATAIVVFTLYVVAFATAGVRLTVRRDIT